MRGSLEQLDWTLARPFLLVLGLGVLTQLLVVVFRRWWLARLRRAAEQSQTRIDDVLVAGISKIGFATTIGVVAYASASLLTLPAPAVRVATSIGAAAWILQVGLCLDRALSEATSLWRSSASDEPARATAATGIGYLLRVVGWVIVALVILSNLGVEISALLAGLGVGGIAAALAVRAALADVIAAIAIYFDRPFDIGDFIVVGSHMGTIEKIGLRSTQVRALSGEQLIFANTDLTSSRIQNFRRMQERRVVVRLGVPYQTPHTTLRSIPTLVRESVEAREGTRFDRCHLAEYADSAIVFELVFWVLSPDYNVFMDVQESIYLAIHRRFEEAGVSFAYPTRTVHLQPAA